MSKLTTAEVLTTLGIFTPAQVRGITRDGLIRPDPPLGAAHFPAWAVLVSHVAPTRNIHDVMKANLIDPDLTRETLDVLESEQGRWALAFIKWTEPCGRWFCPSSAQLNAWPSDAKVRRVFDAFCIEKGLKTAPQPDDVQADLFGPVDAANTN